MKIITIIAMIKKECSGNYNKLILEKSKCVKKCAQDNKYKFEFKNRCYEECPFGTFLITSIFKFKFIFIILGTLFHTFTLF